MNTVPIITTYTRCRHNPGDTLIGEGCRYVIEQAAGKLLPWRIISKFRPEQWEEGKGDFARAPYSVFAGTPQYNNYSLWKFGYDDELWQKLNEYGATMLVLAGGSGEPDPKKSPEEWAKECADDPETVRIITQRTERTKLFTVRDRHGKALLDELGIPSTLLPCTAIFAGDYLNVEYNPEPKRVAIVPNLKPDEETNRKFAEVAALLREDGWSPVMVPHGAGDAKGVGDVETYRTNDYLALARFYGTCEGVISARLHGSLTAYGIGAEHIVNLTVDSRGYAVEEADVPNLILADATPQEIIDEFRGRDLRLDWQDNRSTLKRETLQRYVELIQPRLQ